MSHEFPVPGAAGALARDLALAAFEHRELVEVIHHSFQLDPTCPPLPRPVREVLTEKYGMPDTQLKATIGHVEALAVSARKSKLTAERPMHSAPQGCPSW